MEKMSYGKIYKIRNNLDGKEYVGQTTKTVESRFKGHCEETRNRHISNAIRSYGKDNFTVETVALANNQDELNELERLYVEMFNTMFPGGYNHRAGGNQNGVCSDEMRSKISKARSGQPLLKKRGEHRSEEYRLKISKGLGGKEIKATNLSTGEVKVYKTAHSTRKDGFNPSNVVQICKKVRTASKGWTFEYIFSQDNQSGSPLNKGSGHAQRLEIEAEQSE